MLVPMVRVREMRMTVRQRIVAVRVAMRGAGCQRIGVGVLVMFIVAMRVVVLRRLVGMSVLVTLGQVQPGTQRHQRAGQQQRQRERLAQR